MINRELRLMMKLPTIMRWQIVPMLRPQSVADHSFRVWLLAYDLYDRLIIPSPHKYSQRMVLQHALLHDVGEVLTGDIPSTIKILLGQKGSSERLDEHLRQEFPMAEDAKEYLKGTPWAILIKICDIVEAIDYLKEYHMPNTIEWVSVLRNRKAALEAIYDKGVLNHPDLDWGLIRSWIFYHTKEIYAGVLLD